MASPSTPGPVRRGIVEAQFVEDVHTFMDGKEGDAVMKPLQERYQQYKLQEQTLTSRRALLEQKIPELKRNLAIVNKLQEQKEAEKEAEVDFELADQIFARATIKDPESVCLWLGANVMVEYSLEEANLLLQRQLENATASLEAVIEDLHFLRDQVTTTEVTLARVYNHEVKLRRERRLAEAAQAGDDT
ncbi:prefoldin subunit 3 [Klebsormidium nitens]|uniref:Prefoldin subunit 3 n=1 Tax=Klebsormidium nitens TaxID=105231 RepID=A0A1Y1I066_KLENI|nr:prefoldin subunit 3 [Klebsormidium nitens]|eukprot:GAQ84304.1 prefoldin subunit 3 [Klebsormidium nitens]